MPRDTTTVLRLADLATRKPTPFEITPDTALRAEIARELEINGIKKLRLAGTLQPVGRKDWALDAQLGATVVQPCVITLDPVTSRIDDTVLRTYSADFVAPDAAEAEMPDDDTTEPLPETLDLMHVLKEALSLALPPFPRSDGAHLGAAVYTAPGAAAMTDDDARPFAGLGSLRDALSGEKAKDDPSDT